MQFQMIVTIYIYIYMCIHMGVTRKMSISNMSSLSVSHPVCTHLKLTVHQLNIWKGENIKYNHSVVCNKFICQTQIYDRKLQGWRQCLSHFQNVYQYTIPLNAGFDWDNDGHCDAAKKRDHSAEYLMCESICDGLMSSVIYFWREKIQNVQISGWASLSVNRK